MQAAAGGRFPGPPVRGLALVPAADARAVDLEPLASPLAVINCRMTASAVGDRQMLPRQTNSNRSGSRPTPGTYRGRSASRRRPPHGRRPGADYGGRVRVATWNVNSVKQRVPRLLPWLDQRRPDVVCLQETKLADDVFAELLGAELDRRDYAVAYHGEAQWNGVAILSRVGLEDVTPGLPGAPGFPALEARAVAATCGGIRVQSVYVPNGRVPESDHYRYKLAWLAALRDAVSSAPSYAVICGDMNIAPTDDDVFDPAAYVGQTHVTAPERAALRALQDLGLHDVVRDRWPTDRVFTYWDYRAGMFHQDLGMRIDLVLASAPMWRAGSRRPGWIGTLVREPRRATMPPVIVDLDEAPDGDIGPVVPPPSAPRANRRPAKLPQSS